MSVWVAGRACAARARGPDRLADRTVELEREAEQKARAAATEERARIARELHDIVAHSVTTMVVQAGAERRVLDDSQASTREVLLLLIEQTGRQALGQMRRLLGMLREDDQELALAPQPSLAHVDQLVDQVRAAGMPVELRVEGEPAPLRSAETGSLQRAARPAAHPPLDEEHERSSGSARCSFAETGAAASRAKQQYAYVEVPSASLVSRAAATAEGMSL